MLSWYRRMLSLWQMIKFLNALSFQNCFCTSFLTVRNTEASNWITFREHLTVYKMFKSSELRHLNLKQPLRSRDKTKPRHPDNRGGSFLLPPISPKRCGLFAAAGISGQLSPHSPTPRAGDAALRLDAALRGGFWPSNVEGHLRGLLNGAHSYPGERGCRSPLSPRLPSPRPPRGLGARTCPRFGFPALRA